MKNASKYLVIVLAVVLIGSCRDSFLSVGLGDKMDLEDPTLTVTHYQDGSPIQNGDYVSGKILLQGTSDDDLAVQTVEISLDNGTTWNRTELDSETHIWSYLLDTTQFDDGDRELLFVARDASTPPKTRELKYYLTFDNTPPAVMVTDAMGSLSPSTNRNFTIRGEAADSVRLKSVTAAVTGGGELEELEGTNTWSVKFNSNGTGDYAVALTAEDYAGNITTGFYHIHDLKEKNNGVYLTIEDILTLEQGNTPEGSVIRPSDLADIRNATLDLEVDMTLDEPQIVISTPENGDTQGLGALAVGQVIDDDAVNEESLRISIDGGSWEWNSLPNTTVSGSGRAVYWKYDLSGLSPGDHTIRVKAQDDHGTLKESETVSFTIDSGAPSVDVTAPLPGGYIKTPSVTLIGTAVDDGGIKAVDVSEDNGSTWIGASSSSGDYATWTYSSTDLPDGQHTLKVRATDHDGKKAVFNVTVFVDTKAPEIHFHSPGKGNYVNGEITLKGAFTDDNPLNLGEIKIGKAGAWKELTNLLNWTYVFDSRNVDNAAYADETSTGSGVWKLPVYIRGEDLAGNRLETSGEDFYLFVDNALDRPTVNIISPQDNQVVGGPIVVSGTSFDDEQIYVVQMRIDLNNDGDYDDAFDLNGDGDTSDSFEDERSWVNLSGSNPWSIELNGSGEFYHTSPGHDGTVTIQVRAQDTKDFGATGDIFGEIKSRTVRFDDTIPFFTNTSHESGSYVSGKFDLTTDMFDDDQIRKISISYNGGANYSDITGDAVHRGRIGDYDTWHLEKEINSASYISDSGILYLRLRITDDANYINLKSLNLNVDNIVPTGTFSADLTDIHGAEARVQGTAADSGVVSGIDRIEVYFEKAGQFIHPKTGGTTSVSSRDFSNGTAPWPGDGGYRITVDNPYELGKDTSSNGDKDGYDESLTLEGSTWNWWANFNSNNLPDGLLTVHYVIFDKAGNGRHESAAGFIKNHKPSITGIETGSDLDYSNTVESDEIHPYTGTIKVREKFYIRINAVDDSFAPGDLTYEVFRGSEASGSPVQNTSEGTIDISSYGEGLTSFFIRVTDTDGITAERTVTVNVNNDDVSDPGITMAALTQADVVDGHLEEQGVSLYDGSDPDVSGTVILRGTASDDQRIHEIRLNLSGVGTNHLLAQWDAAKGILVSKDTGNFRITDQSLSEGMGHRIIWEYTWNTHNITGKADNDVITVFTVKDFGTVTDPATVSRQVDVVPYIVKIETFLSGAFSSVPSVFNRTSSGEYPVFPDDTVRVTGFNLGDGVSADIGGTGLTVSNKSLTGCDISLGSPSSGPLTLTVNGIPSVNNVNKNTSPQNCEPNNTNNNLLNDDRIFSIWESQTVAGTSSARYPVMKISDGGKIGFSYTNGETAVSVYDGGPIRTLEYSYTRYNYTTFSYDEDGDYYTVALNSDRIDDDTSSKAVFFSRNYSNRNYSKYNDAWHYKTGGEKRQFEHNYNGTFFNSLRTQYPDLISKVNGSGSRHYMSYYDDSQNMVKFRYFTVGSNAGTINGAMRNYNDSTNSASGFHQVSEPGHSGAYSAVGVTSGGTALVAWYDATDRSLRFAWNTSPDTSNDWSNQIVIDDYFAGQYVEMAVDKGDGIHLAYYSSASGDLKYAYLSRYDAAPVKVTVDSYLSVGTNLDITTIKDGTKYVPYISYFISAYKDTSMSLRMARLVSSTVKSGVSSDLYTGNWLITSLPVDSIPKNYKTSIGVKDGEPVIGFVSDDGLQWIQQK